MKTWKPTTPSSVQKTGRLDPTTSRKSSNPSKTQPFRNIRRRTVVGANAGGWEMIYSGFAMILLTFFIMLCSFASVKSSKLTQFVASFNNAVNILSGGIRLEPGKFYIGVIGETVEVTNAIAKIRKDISGLADELGLVSDIEFAVSKEGLIVRLPDTALFEAGVADISEKSKPFLHKLAKIILETAYPVRIEGHTDDVPIQTEMFPSNWELSTMRAVNVLKYLIGTENISANRLSAAGFGEYKPVCKNDTSENRAKNRRVELIFIAEKAESQMEQ